MQKEEGGKNGRKREEIYHETKGISVRLAGLDT